MSIINFVLFVTSLSFAIGLGVATIIWGINKIFSPRHDPNVHESKLHQIVSEYRKLQRQAEGNEAQEDLTNKELYAYHHGKN